MNRNLINKMIYGNVPKEFYVENKKMLQNSNITFVRTAYIFATFMFFVLSLIAIFNPLVENTLMFYFGFTLCSALLTLVVDRIVSKHESWITVFYILFEIIAFGSAIIAGTIFSPNDLAVQFFVMMIIVPLLYIEKPIYSAFSVTVAALVFSVCSGIIKAGKIDLVQVDLLNTFFCLLVSLFFIYYVRNMNLKNIMAMSVLQVQSEMDLLTGVLNKVSTERLIQNYLSVANDKQSCSLLIMDIDDFKGINDTLGHKQGDQLLKHIGTILKENFREDDVIGRIGGDEFMVLMKNVHSIKVAETKATKIIQSIADVFDEYSTARCSCSIGIANNKAQGYMFQQLYSQADHALYQAKGNGKGCYVVYSLDDEILHSELDTILIVDDSEMSRAVLRACFEDEFNLVEAENGQKALQWIERYSYNIDAILLDIEMPVLNGYDVLKYIKQREQLKDIPVLIITSHDENECLVRELGGCDFIKKPFDPLVVKNRVTQVLKTTKKRDLVETKLEVKG